MPVKKLRNLLKEKAFVDYFNLFLCQPIFGFRILYNFSGKKFAINSSLKKSIKMKNSKLLKWLESKRLPLFIQSSMYSEYKLCTQLRDIKMNKEDFAHICDVGQLDETLIKVIVENIFGHYAGMQQFKKFLLGTNGENILQCINDIMFYCNKNLNVKMMRYELRNLILKYLANGTLFELSSRMKLYLFLESDPVENPPMENAVLDNGVCFDECLFYKGMLNNEPVKAMWRFYGFLVQDLLTYWAPCFVLHLLQQRLYFGLDCLCTLNFTETPGSLNNILHLFNFSENNCPLFMSDQELNYSFLPKDSKRKGDKLPLNTQEYLFGDETICRTVDSINHKMISILASDKLSGYPFFRYLLQTGESNEDQIYLLWEDLCNYLSMRKFEDNYVRNLQEGKIKSLYLLKERKSPDDLLDNDIKHIALAAFKMAETDENEKYRRLLQATNMTTIILEKLWLKYIDFEKNNMKNDFELKSSRGGGGDDDDGGGHRRGRGGDDDDDDDGLDDGGYDDDDDDDAAAAKKYFFDDEECDSLYNDDDDEDSNNVSEQAIIVDFYLTCFDFKQLRKGLSYSNNVLSCLFNENEKYRIHLGANANKRSYRLGKRFFKMMHAENQRFKRRGKRVRPHRPAPRVPARVFKKEGICPIKLVSDLVTKAKVITTEHKQKEKPKLKKFGLNPYLSLRQEGFTLDTVNKRTRRKIVFQKYLQKLCQFLHEMQQPHMKELLGTYVDALIENAEFMNNEIKPVEKTPKYIRKRLIKRHTSSNPPPIFYIKLKKKVLYLADSLQFKKTAHNMLASYKRTKINLQLKNKARNIISSFLEGNHFSETRDNFVFGTSKDRTEDIINDTALKLKLEGASCSLFHKLDIHIIPAVYQIWKKMGQDCLKFEGRGKFLAALGIDKEAFDKKYAKPMKAKSKMYSAEKFDKIIPDSRLRKSQLEEQASQMTKSLLTLTDDDIFWKYRRQFAYNIGECISPDLRKLIQSRGGSQLEYVLVR